MMRERIKEAVYRTIGSVNELLPSEETLEVTEDLVLIGKNGSLDSMAFVNFIVALEEELERELGNDLNIADLLSMQAEDRTTVADLIKVLVERFG